MKICTILFLAFATFAAAAETKKSPETHSTVPKPYPSIIQLTAPDQVPAPAKGLIQSDLGGREIEFFQNASQSGANQLTLADLAKSKATSDQIRMVAETLGSTQETETKEIARLAAAKKVALNAPAAKALTDELAGLNGAKFEKAWIEKVITVNEAAYAGYEGATKSSDADIRTFAEKMLPVAKARLQMANRLGGRPVDRVPATPAPSPSAAAPASARSVAGDQSSARAIPPPVGATPGPAAKPNPNPNPAPAATPTATPKTGKP